MLSIDDDIIIPCATLQRAARVWSANKWSTVGFSPRLGGLEEGSQRYWYSGWKKTYISGAYSIILTKVCFLHRDYLAMYSRTVPKKMLTHIDENRNCEDLTMSNVVAKNKMSPPVWTEGVVYEIADSGISSGTSHFDIRGKCLAKLREMLGLWPWPVGHQKAVKISFFDLAQLIRDPKP